MEQDLALLVGPVIEHFDTETKRLLDSQHALADQLDKLTESLDAVQNTAHFQNLLPYLQKFQDSRKRVNNVSKTVTGIQERLGRIKGLADQLATYGIQKSAPAAAAAIADVRPQV